MEQTTTVGAAFAAALAAKDRSRLLEVLHPDVDFRGLTPNRAWEAGGADAVLAILFDEWLEPKDEVESLEHVETGAFSDRERVGYRISGRNPDGRFVVEQQAFLEVRDGRIAWMRVVCSGFRPA